MGLKLIKDDAGNYRRTWYAAICDQGRRVSRKLKTPLRGNIPLDSAGRFSLDLKGDDDFEASKEAARAELLEILDGSRKAKAEEKTDPGYTARQVYRKVTGRKFEDIRLADLPDRNAERERYALTGDKDADKYNESVRDILRHFAKFGEKYSAGKAQRLKCLTLTGVSVEAVREYYKGLAESFSWATLRKYHFILKSVYDYYLAGAKENPFQTVYKDNYTYKKDAIDKTAVVHEAPTPDQVREIWAYTRTRTDKPYLHRLAVLAACTGMRIGDCCNLTWDKVDLLGYKIHTKTSKTGKPIGVQIFDYAPDSADYHEILGELRRELEAALAERAEGEAYVIPEAHRIYATNKSRINKEGKVVFARALFSKPEPEEAVLIGEEREKKTPAEILAEIDAARIDPVRKARVRLTYELYATGKSYSYIATKTGKKKCTASDDLAFVENLTGESIRPGNRYTAGSDKATMRKLLKKTRRARNGGQRDACLYGWHSFRVSFVVMSIEMGVALGDLKDIVGHSTIDIVLHYYNPKELKAAENMRITNQRRNREKNGCATAVTARPTLALPPPSAIQADDDIAARLAKLDALLGAGIITQEERDERRRAILAEI